MFPPRTRADAAERARTQPHTLIEQRTACTDFSAQDAAAAETTKKLHFVTYSHARHLPLS